MLDYYLPSNIHRIFFADLLSDKCFTLITSLSFFTVYKVHGISKDIKDLEGQCHLQEVLMVQDSPLPF